MPTPSRPIRTLRVRPTRSLSPIFSLYSEVRNWFSNLKTSTKWALVVTLKSAAVSFALGAIAPYATASYAIRNGFRVPVEGVPYLQFAIAIASFASFFIAMAMLASVMAAIQQIGFLDNLAVKIRKNYGKSIEMRRKFYGHHFVLLMSFAPILLALLGLFFCDTCNNKIEILGENLSYNQILIAFAIALSVSFTSFYFNARGDSVIGVQAKLSVPLVALMVIALFSDSVYGSFLRIIRYGGGIQVTVITQNRSTGQQEEIKGYLMIQNDSVAILMTNDRGSFVEIPASEISRKIVSASPAWETPHYNSIQQLNLLPAK